ncbi:MAG: DUF1295 domain-containing protein [Burkholderiales bacterium]
MPWPEILPALAVVLALALGGWVWSVRRSNVTIVDSLWPLFFPAALLAYLATAEPVTDNARRILIMALVAVWALRLCAYLAWRSAGAPEDRRYRAIRARNEPGFAWKSAYLIFGFQAVLAWVISAPLYAAVSGAAPLSALDALGAGLWLAGFLFQAIADVQLVRFRRFPENVARVLDTGLWRYTRHPNYFGECCMAWGYWLIACGAGGEWTVFAPIVMTVLLLRVSGVALLEKDIGERRPAYADYIARTNAFLPGPPRTRRAQS